MFPTLRQIAKLIPLVALVFFVSCASKETGGESSTAGKKLTDKYDPKVGVATKEDLIQEFGPANWCRQNPTGDETCRFYKKTGTKWMGDKTDGIHRETFDEAFADFDPSGLLKSFKINSQR